MFLSGTKCFSKFSSIIDVFSSTSDVRFNHFKICLNSVPITAFSVATCILSLFLVNSVAVAYSVP